MKIQGVLNTGLGDSFINCWTLEGYIFLKDLSLHDVGRFSSNNPRVSLISVFFYTSVPCLHSPIHAECDDVYRVAGLSRCVCVR